MHHDFAKFTAAVVVGADLAKTEVADDADLLKEDTKVL
jgi:hypothetical protein